jgi:hypothetical protein
MNSDLIDFLDKNKQNNWMPSFPLPLNLWESDWPWAPIINPIDLTEVVKEMNLIDHFFVSHREKDQQNSYRHQGWNSLTLYGIDYDKTENYDRYGYKSQEEADYEWTSICNLIPKTVEFIKNLPFTNYGRVRIMRLSPGGYVMPHTDGKGRIFGPFNIALTNPKGCEFVFEDRGIVPFEPGRGFLLDLGIKHCVVNNSQEYRYHVIVHGETTYDIIPHIERSIHLL